MSQMFCRYCIPIPRLLLDRVIYSDRVLRFDERADISEYTRIYHGPAQANKKVSLSKEIYQIKLVLSAGIYEVSAGGWSAEKIPRTNVSQVL